MSASIKAQAIASLLLMFVLLPVTSAQKDKDNEPTAVLTFLILKEDNGKPVRNAAVIMHPVNNHGRQERGGLELKTEPTVYSFGDLQRDQTTVWDGVTNPVALRNLRSMKPGEQLVIYHTGDEKSAVGTATVVSVDASDPRNPQIKIKVGKPLAKPVTLAEVKANKLFADSPLVRQGRLSVVPLSEAQHKFVTGG